MKETLPPLSAEAKLLARSSLYEHYKGNRYKVLYVARHSETLEEHVVYQSQYGAGEIWIRPLSMFLEHIVIEGKKKPRFRPISD